MCTYVQLFHSFLQVTNPASFLRGWRDGGADEEESQVTGRTAIETRSSEALISEAMEAVAMMEEGQKDDGSQHAPQQVS